MDSDKQRTSVPLRMVLDDSCSVPLRIRLLESNLETHVNESAMD